MAFGGLKGTLVGNGNSTTNPSNAAGSVVVAVGDLIFGVMGEQTTLTVTAVTDNLGNTYSATQAGTDAGTSTGRAFYSRVTVAGTLTQVRFAATPSTDDFACVAAVIEGPFLDAPLDANPTNITSDITSPFTCPATGTLTRSRSVVMAWGVATGATVWAATSPNLLATQQANSSTLHTVIGYQAVAATTTVTPAFTAASNPTDAVLGTTSFMGTVTTSSPIAVTQGQTVSALWKISRAVRVTIGQGLGLGVTRNIRKMLQVCRGIFWGGLSGSPISGLSISGQTLKRSSMAMTLSAVYHAAGGGTITNKAISLTQAQTVSLIRAVLKRITLTQAQAASLFRTTAKITALTQGQAVTLLRSTLKRITVSQGQTVSLIRSAGKLIAVAAAQAITLPRSISKVVAVAQAHAVTARKTVAKIVAAMVQGQLVTLRNTAQKIIGLAAMPLTAAVLSVRAALKFITVSQAQALTVLRTTNKIIAATQAQAVNLRRSVTKIVTQTQAQTVALRRSLTKVLALAQGHIVTLYRGAAKRIVVTAGHTAQLVRTTNKRLAIALGQAVSISRIVPRTFSIAVTQSQLVAVRGALSKVITLGISSLVRCVAILTSWINPLSLLPGSGKRSDILPGYPQADYGTRRAAKKFRPIWDRIRKGPAKTVDEEPIRPVPLPPASMPMPAPPTVALPTFDHLAQPNAAQIGRQLRDARDMTDIARTDQVMTDLQDALDVMAALAAMQPPTK